MSLLPVPPPRRQRTDPRGRRRIAPLTRQIAAVSAFVVAGLFASMSSRLARADCLPNPPANGQTVTCTGPAPTTVPLDASAASGVTVNINADAVLTGSTNLITLGPGAQLNNFGSIQPVSTGAGSIGVVALGADSVLRNFGTLTATGFNALTFASIGANSVLRNEVGGRINVNGDLATGLMAASTDGNQLINAGQITLNTFQGSGMYAQQTNRTVLTNTATGVIESNLNEAFGIAASGGIGHVLRNDGTIVTRGQASHGMLLLEASDSSMTNAGSITTSGGASELDNRAFGMFVFSGQGNTLQNLAGGVITASGLGSSGMEIAESTNNLLRNGGTVNVSGTGAHGLYVLSGANNTLENRGTVNTSGQRGNGMRADDGNSTIINSGDLLVGGRDAFGVFMQGDNNALFNSGTIRASGINADGVLSNTVAGAFVARIENTGSIISERSFAVRGVNGQENLINSGVIRSDVGTAIDLRAGNDSLTLRTGSQVTGLADGGTGTDGVILEGAGTASNAFANFETLRMTGTDWTLSGSGAFGNTQVESGVLRVSGTLTSPVTVQAGTQLHIGTGAASGTVAGNITDNGTVVFNRSDAVNYGGVISGNGSVTKNGVGTLTLTANNTYTGATIINQGVLAFNNPNNLGTLGNPLVFNGGTLRYLASTSFIGRPVTLLAGGGTIDTNGFSNEYRGVASGAGAMTKIGAGTLSLTGNNTYTGGTTISAGTLQVGLGGTTGSLAGNIANNAALVFNRSDALTYSGVISGTGTLTQSGTGITTLAGANTLTGATTVSAGTLRVNGSLASASTTVQNGATLGGTGSIAGAATVQNGGHLAPGASPGMLTIGGDLSLSAGSVLDYELGQSNLPGGAFNDLSVVGGNLSLDGTLNVTQPAGGNFGPGVYRLINYGGTLNNQGLDLGAMPAGGPFFVQTSVANQVNLVNTQGLMLNFWDGNNSALFNNATVNGGSGTWLATPAIDAWTEGTGTVNASWQPNGFAVFQGTPGIVTVDNSAGAVTFSGAQFAVDGYTVIGQPLTTTTPDTIIRVGDGTAAGAAMTATIGAVIQGSGGLDKTDAGTLVLTGSNTYTGNTSINGGTLQLGDGGTTGSFIGNVSNNGTLAFNRSDVLTFSGLISGTGRVVQQGTGTVTLAPSSAGGNTYAGGTLLAQGVLAMPADNVLGAPTGGVTFNGGTLQWLGSFELSATRPVSIEAGGGTLDTQGFEAIVEQGMTGAGALTKAGAGTLILQGASTYGGGTTVSAGTLVVGDSTSPGAALSGGGTVLVNPGATLGGYGSVTGDVVNNGVLKVANAIASATVAPPAATASSKPGVQSLAKPAILDGGNGGFTINGTLQNAGLAQVRAVSGTPGNTLTVNSYVGAPGSRVALNTVLGVDNSPSDKLVINGGSGSGASTLQITNAGGGGALTTGDGIVVVDAANGATTAGSAFALGARAAAGAYEYLLVRGGTTNGESWFLRTTLPLTAPGAAAPPPAPAPPDGSPRSVAPTVLLPNYRVEVPLDMSLPVLANRLGIAMLGTYHDRAGEDSVTATSEGLSRMGAWGRVFGASGEARNGSASTNPDRLDDFTHNGPSYDYNEAGVQTGIELLRRVDASGQSDVAGAYIAMGHIDSNVDAVYGGSAGTASMYGYSLGGYWTRKGASGWYVDGVLQGTRYDNVKTKSIFAEKLETDGWGVAASLEAGYPFVLAPGWALEPQGQLVYQWTKLEDSADSFARISFDDTSTFYGRIGARLTRRVAQGEAQDLTAWARLNIWHAFDSDATTNFASLQGFNPVALSAPIGASTWAQVGVGLSGQIARNASAFGSVDYNRSLDGANSDGWSGRVGVRFKW